MATVTPSYIQPQYYTLDGASYAQGNPPPYTEYAHEVDYLGSQQTLANDSGFWEAARNDAVRYLGNQSGQCVHMSLLVTYDLYSIQNKRDLYSARPVDPSYFRPLFIFYKHFCSIRFSTYSSFHIIPNTSTPWNHNVFILVGICPWSARLEINTAITANS